MEFKPALSTNPPPPKNLYPCLATLTLGNEKPGRRLSMNSNASDDEGGLKRVISGNRRNTSFGQVADRGDRKSFDAGARPSAGGVMDKGTWYWRVQAGVTDTHLVLMPLSQPPNPLLITAPPPLSEAMPAHSSAPHGTGHATNDHESIGTKVKNLFTGGARKQSKDETNAAGDQAQKHETIVDQTGGGEQLPSASANAMGADNVNANAETGWPEYIAGDKLGVIMVSLESIDHANVKLHQHKKESSFITVPVTAHMAGVGQNSETAPKSGTIKFEFDKEWIGAKGEAELLHHYITSAAQNPPPAASHFVNQNFQLGGDANNTSAVGSNDVAPDQSVSTASSGKVAGSAI